MKQTESVLKTERLVCDEMLAAAKMDDSLANGEKKWNFPTARNNNDCPGGRQETDIFE